MATMYRDQDADIAVLQARKVGFIGYGNQGHAQAQNMRDSGLDVTIGNIEDEYKQRAIADGFVVKTIEEVAATADVLLILIPDEVQPQVFAEKIRPYLKPRDVVSFASGYNIHFAQIALPDDIDVIMVAPRMIGQAVRRLFKQGAGYPCLIGVDRDVSGAALPIALSIAKAIGATRLGAFMSSFREEAVMDLFAEQMLWAGINKLALLYFEKLVENGCDPDIVATELHLSGEFLEIARAMISEGFFKQLKLHSHTSQYGQLSRADRMTPKPLRDEMDAIMKEICSGTFAREWAAEQKKGLPALSRLWEEALEHPINQAEERMDSLRRIVAQAQGG